MNIKKLTMIIFLLFSSIHYCSKAAQPDNIMIYKSPTTKSEIEELKRTVKSFQNKLERILKSYGKTVPSLQM